MFYFLLTELKPRLSYRWRGLPVCRNHIVRRVTLASMTLSDMPDMHDMHVVEDQVPFLSRHFRLVPHSDSFCRDLLLFSHTLKGVEGNHI